MYSKLLVICEPKDALKNVYIYVLFFFVIAIKIVSLDLLRYDRSFSTNRLRYVSI